MSRVIMLVVLSLWEARAFAKGVRAVFSGDKAVVRFQAHTFPDVVFISGVFVPEVKRAPISGFLDFFDNEVFGTIHLPAGKWSTGVEAHDHYLESYVANRSGWEGATIRVLPQVLEVDLKKGNFHKEMPLVCQYSPTPKGAPVPIRGRATLTKQGDFVSVQYRTQVKHSDLGMKRFNLWRIQMAETIEFELLMDGQIREE